MYLTKRQSLIVAVGILGIFFFVVGMLTVGPSTPTKEPSEESSEPPASSTDPKPAETAAMQPMISTDGSKIILHEFHRSESRDGKKLWEVKAERGNYHPESNSADLWTATLWLYQKDGKVVQLTAGAATVFFSGTELTKADLSAGTVVVLNNEVTIKAEKAVFDKASGSVFSPSDVEIDSNMVHITGTELQVDVEQQHFKLLRNVATKIKPRNNREVSAEQ